MHLDPTLPRPTHFLANTSAAVVSRGLNPRFIKCTTTQVAGRCILIKSVMSKMTMKMLSSYTSTIRKSPATDGFTFPTLPLKHYHLPIIAHNSIRCQGYLNYQLLATYGLK